MVHYDLCGDISCSLKNQICANTLKSVISKELKFRN